MRGKDDRLGEAVQTLDDSAQPTHVDIGLTMDGDDEVRAWCQVRGEPLLCERNEEAGGVRHHVTDDRRGSCNAFGLQRLARVFVGTEQEVCEAVDLDAVAFLGHGQIAATESRLDVRQRNPCPHARTRARDSRVRVAEDDHPIGPLERQHIGDAALQDTAVRCAEIERMGRLVEAELLVEDRGHRLVVVLSGVDRDLLDPRVGERQ